MKYRKKPVVVEVMRFLTNNEADNKNMNDIVLWINQGKSDKDLHAWHNATDIYINTLEGVMRAECGDFIIKGVNGEFYPCKPEIFEKTYEPVEVTNEPKR